MNPTVGLMLATTTNPDTGTVDPGRVLEAARRAEAAGFDGVYVGDHLVHPRPILESVVTLSAVAAVTSRVMLGPCVLLAGLREPAVLAKQLGTLAAFAPGRLRVGVGVGGEYRAEFDLVGVPHAGRGQAMEDAVREVRALLSGSGARGDVDGPTIAPAAPEVPFLFAGWAERALRRAATYGDGWIGYLLGPDSFARRRALLLGYREELGLAGTPFTTGMLIPVHVDAGRASAAEAWARLTDSSADFPEKLFVAGDPDDVVAQLGHYLDVGCTEFVLAPADHGDGYLDQVDLLSTEILPRLTGSRP